MKFLIFFVTLVLFAYSVDRAHAYKLHLGVGNLSPFIGKMQTDNQGGSSGLDFNPMLLVGTPFELKWKHWPRINAELGLGLPQSGESEHISKFHYFFQGVFWYQLSDWSFRLGAGFAMTRLSSDGGEIEMLDGNSTTTFYLPPTSSTSRNVIIPFGLEYSLNKKLFFRFDGQLYNAFSSDKRAISLLFSLNHPITIKWGQP